MAVSTLILQQASPPLEGTPAPLVVVQHTPPDGSSSIQERWAGNSVG